MTRVQLKIRKDNMIRPQATINAPALKRAVVTYRLQAAAEWTLLDGMTFSARVSQTQPRTSCVSIFWEGMFQKSAVDFNPPPTTINIHARCDSVSIPAIRSENVTMKCGHSNYIAHLANVRLLSTTLQMKLEIHSNFS